VGGDADASAVATRPGRGAGRPPAVVRDHGETMSDPAHTTVLVVDDEDALVDLVRGYLAREGFRVVTAADGPTALRLAEAERPDLVVLDLMLPVLDGVEVCRRLRAFS